MTATKPSEAALWQLFSDRNGQYEVRTRHVDGSGKPIYINELIKESSPYLLQHAHNPVNWMAWDDDAFARAKAENKPIFLSIGYATCHWCHVMEHESFEDLVVAKFLSQHFICIKVDREQHPVVDDYYMTALQLIAGQGGWPMSSFLTPEAEPFMAGTYFPQPRFLELLNQINDMWQQEQGKLIEQGKRVKDTVARYLSVDQSNGVSGDNPLSVEWMKPAIGQLSHEVMDMHDAHYGGFGGAPKFPQEAWLQFLMYQYLDTKDDQIAQTLTLTLKQMQQGGIHDHLAGGFHRYCVDEKWLVPHFEKMLYNQAQLLQLYAQAAVVFADESFATTAKNIVNFLKAEMLSEQGLFYSALDADSISEEGEMVEGAFYVWSWSELNELLCEAELAWLASHYAVFPEGNFEGNNILFQQGLLLDKDEFLTIKNKLLTARAQKARPLTDDKVIVSWNAMTIEALARAGVLLSDEGFLSLARKAYENLRGLHWSHCVLWRVSQAGQRHHIPAVLSDYSNMACAALALRDASYGEQAAIYAKDAAQLLSVIKEKFWHQGALYQSSVEWDKNSWEPQVVNAKDGATVSATAKLLQALSLSNAFDGDYSGDSWFDEILASHAPSIKQQNTAHSGLITACLLRTNHVLGQQVIEKEGLTIRCQNVEGGWEVSCEAQDSWSLNDVNLSVLGYESCQGTNDEYIKPAQSMTDHIAVFSVAKRERSLELTWALCDDKHCLPPQSMKLALY